MHGYATFRRVQQAGAALDVDGRLVLQNGLHGSRAVRSILEGTVANEGASAHGGGDDSIENHSSSSGTIDVTAASAAASAAACTAVSSSELTQVMAAPGDAVMTEPSRLGAVAFPMGHTDVNGQQVNRPAAVFFFLILTLTLTFYPVPTLCPVLTYRWMHAPRTAGHFGCMRYRRLR